MRRFLVISIILSLITLPIAWYLLSPLFIDKTVSEEIPANNVNVENFVFSYSGAFLGVDSFHQVDGNALIISGEKTDYLRFENFKSTNGPDLKVYLSKDLEATDFVDLGELKGNIGDQNYELSTGINLNEYKYVLIWCKQFSVLFGYAELSPIV